MELSIVIVNYNVKFFLDLAIKSTLESCKEIESEIFVVDNNSTDNSKEFLTSKYPKESFPNLTFIFNKENLGFSKANNQAIKLCKGKYVLLLNPDTIVAEDSFKKCIEFMEATPDAGAIGVRMIDGNGNFLPESKRGLPTPSVSLYKMSGLSKLFPKSKTFGKYHLGYLSEFKNHKVDVLSGAFMFIRKATLEKVGLLDESYFMYGEDIDLSYRINQSTYQNYYLSDTSIIHFKGESTKKQSARYVKVFYGAMKIFVQNHFGGSGAGIVSSLLSIAIYFRAALAILQRIIVQAFLPVLDFFVLYLGFFSITKYWEEYNKWVTAIYPESYYTYHITFYILFLLLSVFISGGYKKPVSSKRILRGVFIGGLLLFGLYGLAPKSMQYSRAILGLGIGWSLIGIILVRTIIQFIKYGNIDLGAPGKLHTLIAGKKNPVCNYLNHLESSFQTNTSIGVVTVNEEIQKNNVLHLGYLKDIQEIIHIFKINEVKFCLKDLKFKDIIHSIQLKPMGYDIKYKIVNQEDQYVLGSESKNSIGTKWSFDEPPMYYNPEIQDKKRLQDLIVCLFIPLFIPLIIVKLKWVFLTNYFSVLFHKKHWVNPYKTAHYTEKPLKNGVFEPSSILQGKHQKVKNIANVNQEYIRNFDPNMDLRIIWFNLLH